MATRDRSSRIGFSNTNVYYLYRKAKAAAETAQAPQAKAEAPKVFRESDSYFSKRESTPDENLKAWDLKSRVLRPETLKDAKIEAFSPQKIEAPMSPTEESQIQSLENLKSNLDHLQDLHSRLRFMLKELEQMVAKKK